VDGRIARLPAGEDPDDFVRKNGAPAFQKLIEGARPMLDQFIQDASRETSVPGRVAALETVAQLLVKVRNPTTRELYARQLAVVLGLTNQQVGRALREAQEQGQRSERDSERRRDLTGPDGAGTKGVAGAAGAGRAGGMDQRGADGRAVETVVERPLPRDELELLALIATYADLCGTPEAARAGELLVDPGARQLFAAAREAIAGAGRLDVPAWLDAGPADVRRSLSSAMMDAGLSRADNPAAKLRALSCRLELQRVEAEISMTARLLEQARNRGDTSATQAMMVRGIELDKTKQGLKSSLQRP
jgi:DNA primase